MRLYPPGSDPESPEALVANVWDWDPEWQVVWIEDGVRRGALSAGVGMDPLAVARFDGDEVPKHRPWVQPVPTEHLLRADITGASGSIVVEATDRFGRIYTAQLR